MDIRYPALLKREETRFLVKFIDLSDTFTEGATEDEALFNAAEVLSAMLDWRLDNVQTVSPPSANVPDAHYIAPDAKTQAALLVRLARGERSLADLARALETSWLAAKRLEDTRHWSSLKQLEKTATALGYKLVLSFESL